MVVEQKLMKKEMYVNLVATKFWNNLILNRENREYNGGKKMETQNELEKEVGKIESERKSLKPRKVKIVKVAIEEVGEKKNKKVVCQVDHPDADVPIAISAVSYLRDKAVKTTGLWYNLDKEDNLQLGSALTILLEKTDSKNIKALEGKEVETELDGNFLCFKAY